jgi:hypothetical protein
VPILERLAVFPRSVDVAEGPIPAAVELPQEALIGVERQVDDEVEAGRR